MTKMIPARNTSRILGHGLYSIYYKVWQKVFTKCDRYDKV